MVRKLKSRIVRELSCPRCGSKEFLEGPHGGNSINIKCSKCGYWMNVTPLPIGKYWITDEEEIVCTNVLSVATQRLRSVWDAIAARFVKLLG